MFEFLKGKVDSLTATHVVIDCQGVGYKANISLYTYEALKNLNEAKVLVHLSISENSQTLYGFKEESERYLFRQLISISGVGPATARVILSSQTTNEIIHAIIHGNISLLNSIKGIGPKTAQRIVVELQDKMGKLSTDQMIADIGISGQASEEAVLALEALGFAKNTATKVVARVLKSDPSLRVEQVIKQALKLL